MPTYSYRCTACGHAFDVQQSFSDASLTQCPSCGGALRKVFSPVGVTFNGSGFYRTDSRPASSSPAKSDAGTAAAPAPASPSSSSSSASSSSSSD